MKFLANVILSLLIAAQLLAMENYFWLTDYEHSERFPDDVMRFWGDDTLWGPTHSNDFIATMEVRGLPVSYSTVQSSRGYFRPGSPNPAMRFLGSPPVFNVPPIVFPDSLIWLREAAKQQHNFLSVPEYLWYGSVRGNSIWFYYAHINNIGESPVIDTTDAAVVIDLADYSKVIFINGTLLLRGVLDAQGCQLLLGCSRDIRLIDNLMLEGTDITTGRLPEDATSRIALASEANITIANTWENGRHNRERDADIVITAMVFALGGSFMFEHQNDIGDSIPPVYPDERGYIYLNGGVTQKFRGYTHRSNLGGTGYLKRYFYDERLRNWRTGVFESFRTEDEFTPVSDPLFPAQFTLAVSPNPFNASTTIRFTLPNASNVRAVVYDVLGREVAELVDASFSAGSHQLSWHAAEQSTGVYFLRFETLGQMETRKLMLIK